MQNSEKNTFSLFSLTHTANGLNGCTCIHTYSICTLRYEQAVCYTTTQNCCRHSDGIWGTWHWYSLCRNEGVSDPLEVSQCSSDPSSEHVNKWSGLEGWKWTSHTVKTTVKVSCVKTQQILQICDQMSTQRGWLWKRKILTFGRVRLHQWEGHVALPYIPDAQHAVLASCGNDVLLVWVSVYTVERNSISSAVAHRRMTRLSRN